MARKLKEYAVGIIIRRVIHVEATCKTAAEQRVIEDDELLGEIFPHSLDKSMIDWVEEN